MSGYFTQQIVVSLLARTDALFVPSRDPMANRHRVVTQRRARFRSRGLPWSSDAVMSGLDETGRKQVERDLDDLVGRGIATSFRKGLKTLGVRLTDEGDAYGRALAGLPQLDESLPVLEAIRSCTECAEVSGRTWVPETALAGVAWGDNEHRKAFVELEDKLLPALVRGLVGSNCSVLGHCWYALEPGPIPKVARDPTSLNPEVRLDYYARFHAEFDALALARPENEREIGDVPMPVSPVRKG